MGNQHASSKQHHLPIVQLDVSPTRIGEESNSNPGSDNSSTTPRSVSPRHFNIPVMKRLSLSKPFQSTSVNSSDGAIDMEQLSKLREKRVRSRSEFSSTSTNTNNNNSSSSSSSSVVGTVDQQPHAFKILLLGTSNSGKSTIYRYLNYSLHIGQNKKNKHLRGNSYNRTRNTLDEYLEIIKVVLVMNCVQFLQTVQKHYPHLGSQESFQNESSKTIWNRLLGLNFLVSFTEVSALVDQDVQFVKQLQDLWTLEHDFRNSCIVARSECDSLSPQSAILLLPHIYKLYDREERVHLENSVKEMAILALKSPTSGLVQSELFGYMGQTLQFIDVGGTRNERRKWQHVLGTTEFIFFCVALDQLFDEDAELDVDSHQCRITESLKLFEQIANNEIVCQQSKIVLIFTHKDKFIRKLLKKDLKCVFGNALPTKLRHSLSDNRPMTIESCSPVHSYLLNRSSGLSSSQRQSFSSYFSRCTETERETFNFGVLLEDYNRDLMNYICFFLNARQLVKLSYVSYTLYEISTSDLIWRQLCMIYEPDIDHNEVMTLYWNRYLNGMQQRNSLTLGQRVFQKKPYKFYFEMGGGVLIENVDFVVSQFLKRVNDEERRREMKEFGVIVTNCLDIVHTKKMLESVLNRLITQYKDSSEKVVDHNFTSSKSPR
jgi:guanine nucleotide-binding protein G(i) subunit alpha